VMLEAPKLGQLVKFNSSAKYPEYNDGMIWRVVGLSLKKDGVTVCVTIARPNRDDRFMHGWDEVTDGFLIEELDVFEPSCESCKDGDRARAAKNCWLCADGTYDGWLAQA